MKNKLKLSEQKCIRCEEFIPELRLKALPGTKTCVNCSDVKTKKPVTVQLGEGDHTYNELVILEDEQFNKYMSQKSIYKQQQQPPEQSA